MSMKAKLFFTIVGILSLLTALSTSPIRISAQEVNKTSYKGTIIEINQETRNVFGQEREVIIYIVEIDKEGESEMIEIIEQGTAIIRDIIYKEGDKVIVESTEFENNTTYNIGDFQRTDSMLILFLIFVILVLAIAKLQGLNSLVGLGISYFVIFFVVLKPVLDGTNPVLTAILAALIIVPINFYLSHGLNAKTTYAAVSTFITLVIIGLLSVFFVRYAKLSGMTSDEAGFIVVFTDGLINIRELLVSAIIIGALGILDDITISQSSIAHQLKHAKPSIDFKELYQRTISVGRDHIASLVNTLILVYTSASLPLLLLFLNNQKSFEYTVNSEVVAQEIVIMLLTSIGLILAVPISTLISCYFVDKKDAKDIKVEEGELHVH